MKEPWKKSCNGKVVITLNNADNSEKAEGGAAATGPTEVEVPVDLAWASHRSEKRCSAPKAVILLGVVLVLGLTVVTLFKVQNLIYTTTYVNWRMQELESTVNENIDDVKLIKYKIDEYILDEKNNEIASMRGARAEPLIASGHSKNVDSDDLRLSESQNQNHKLTNSLNSEKKASEATGKGVDVETKSENKEQTELNDVSNHPNPADPEEWIKPLVETFDILGSQPMEDQFIHNVLMKLLMPENNMEVVELNKMQEARDAENAKMILNSMNHRNVNERENMMQQNPVGSIMMRALMPPVSGMKVFHFNARPEAQTQEQQNSMEEEMPPKMSFNFKQMLPPLPFFNDIIKNLPLPGNMKIINLNDKQVPEQSSEEDMPKIAIQTVKVRVIPLPDEFRKEMPEGRDQSNIEVIRLNESPEPSQEVEAPRRLPFEFHPLGRSYPDAMPEELKDFIFRPFGKFGEQQDNENQQREKFNILPIPLDDIVKSLMRDQQLPQPQQLQQQQQQQQQPQESNEGNVEITKMRVDSHEGILPIPKALMEPVPMLANYAPMHLINVPEPQQEQQPPQPQPQQQQQPQEDKRSTKLNPVDDWNMSPPAAESVQN